MKFKRSPVLHRGFCCLNIKTSKNKDWVFVPGFPNSQFLIPDF